MQPNTIFSIACIDVGRIRPDCLGESIKTS